MQHLILKIFPALVHLIQFLYQFDSYLLFREFTALSQEGCQQGDPLGSFLFSLVLQPLLFRLAEECDLDLLLFYLDDGILVGSSAEVMKASEIIVSYGNG